MNASVFAAVRGVVGICVLAVAGCAPADPEEKARSPVVLDDEGEVVGTVSSALSNGAVQWINGTYTGCVSHTGSWSVRVSGATAMTNAALSVVKNDSTCVLTMTGIYADQLYTATPAVVLGTAYAAVTPSFGSGAAQFNANAKLDASQFAANFTISLVYGDTTTATSSVAVNSAYTAVQSSTVTLGVTPPSYTIDVSSFAFQLDALKVVTSVSGAAVLTDGASVGSAYAIDMGTLPATPTYAQVAVAWTAAVTTQKPISGSNPSVPAAQFGIAGLSLLSSTQVRTLIIQRTVFGVSAYQLFRITFTS